MRHRSRPSSALTQPLGQLLIVVAQAALARMIANLLRGR